MRTATHRSIAATAFAALTAMVVLFNVGVAHASCPGIKIRNNTGCDLTICFYNALGGMYCQNVGANSSTPATWPAGFMPIGVVSNAGTQFPWGAGCTACLSLHIPGTVLTCCVMVCPDPAQCAVDINSCPAPCNP